jgi:hypothetical protein
LGDVDRHWIRLLDTVVRHFKRYPDIQLDPKHQRRYIHKLVYIRASESVLACKHSHALIDESLMLRSAPQLGKQAQLAQKDRRGIAELLDHRADGTMDPHQSLRVICADVRPVVPYDWWTLYLVEGAHCNIQ